MAEESENDEPYVYAGDIAPEDRTRVIEAAAKAGYQGEMAQVAAHAINAVTGLSEAPLSFSITDERTHHQPVTYLDDDLLGIPEIMDLCDCGKNKAQRILQALPSKKIGNKRVITYGAFKAYLDEHGSIKIKW